ncbi:hypothetical protein L915_16436 [Phytophthora nicotianae]|uniref:Uncharacterized protein n=1 Tax=Phytophthora nicotianae TaxID=4792 RepID=W2I990_PHYNI|nr:hypothetical protein L915_16436 [Phytophthora nicotianae]ETL30731.1 hypothetical protein L916_16335 [Phytophthora nicotianae]
MKYQKSIIKATVRDASDGGTPERRRKIRRRKKTSTRQFILSWKTSDIVPQQNLDQDGNSLVQDGIRLGLRTPTEIKNILFVLVGSEYALTVGSITEVPVDFSKPSKL